MGDSIRDFYLALPNMMAFAPGRQTQYKVYFNCQICQSQPNIQVWKTSHRLQTQWTHYEPEVAKDPIYCLAPHLSPL